MAIWETTIRTGKFDALLPKLEQAVVDGSWSADLEDGSDFKEGEARCSVRVFERYSMMGGNRLSLTVTLFQNGEVPIRLSAITAGGSEAVFFKMNTWAKTLFFTIFSRSWRRCWNKVRIRKGGCVPAAPLAEYRRMRYTKGVKTARWGIPGGKRGIYYESDSETGRQGYWQEGRDP